MSRMWHPKKWSKFLHFFYNCCGTYPLFANFASTNRKGQTFTLQYKKCIPHVPRRKYYSNEVSRVQNDLTIHSPKMEGLTTKLLHSEKAIFVIPCPLFHRFSFLLSNWLFTESHVHSIIPNTSSQICTIDTKSHNYQEMKGIWTLDVTKLWLQLSRT